ncbi:putative dynein light chain, type protein [Helianthus annuus]|nr:putative dynein light chain, type protein [Helianthus annuus]
MEEAEKELERRSKFLSNLIQKKKATDQQNLHQQLNIKVKASDMSIVLQNKAFECAKHHIASTGNGIKIDSKRLALALKKFCSFASKNLAYVVSGFKGCLGLQNL